jgi:hypothetical protein
MDFWLSHKWTSVRGRSLAIAGKTLRQFKCRHCRRDFVQETGSGERYAVHVSMFGFDRLADEVTDRWLKQPCPHTAPRSDDDDRLTRHAAAPWYNEPLSKGSAYRPQAKTDRGVGLVSIAPSLKANRLRFTA